MPRTGGARARALASVVLVAVAGGVEPSDPPAAPSPPPTRRDDFKKILHGVEIVDPYRWLESDRSPETRAWIDAQNRSTHALLDDRPGRQTIHGRLAALKDVEAHFRPEFAGDRLIVQTDWKAPRWRFVEVDLRDPAPEKWREIVPEGEHAIRGFTPVGGRLLVHYLRNVTSRLELVSLEGRVFSGAELARASAA